MSEPKTSDEVVGAYADLVRSRQRYVERATAMEDALRQAVDHWPQFDSYDDPKSKSDYVDAFKLRAWFYGWREQVKQILVRGEAT